MGAAREPVSATGIVILSREVRTRDELKRLFGELNHEFDNLDVRTLDMNQIKLVDAAARLVVLDLENWVPSDGLALNELRSGGYSGPVLVLNGRLSESSSSPYGDDRVVFFDRSRGGHELLGIGRRFIRGLASSPRKFVRHITNENAEVRIDGCPLAFACKVRNISKGGALLIAEQALAVGVGDSVIVKIHLAQLNRLYHVRARVTWIKLPRFGVEFIASVA